MKRKNIFDVLYSSVSKSDKEKIDIIKSYVALFCKFSDIYFNDNSNTNTFKYLYLEETYYTNEDICYYTSISISKLYDFLYRIEKLVKYLFVNFNEIVEFMTTVPSICQYQIS